MRLCARLCFCVFSTPTAVPRCLTMSTTLAGLRIQTMPGRPLSETACLPAGPPACPPARLPASQPACLPACLIFYVHPQIFYIPHLIFCIPSLIFYEPPKYSTYPYRTSQERGVQLHNSASPWARTVPIRCLCRILEGVCRIVDGLHKISDGVTIGVRRIFWTE